MKTIKKGIKNHMTGKILVLLLKIIQVLVKVSLIVESEKIYNDCTNMLDDWHRLYSGYEDSKE